MNEQLTKLLIGRSIVEVSVDEGEGLLVLDDGTRLRLGGN